MNKKLNCILLIDDDEPTNFLNKRMLEEMQCAYRIMVIQKATDALEYLRNATAHDEGIDFPDLIFLDVNMPAMDGWEFLHAYNSINKPAHPVSLFMLTTSLNPEDEQKAKESSQVTGFKSKPLTQEMVEDILEHIKAPSINPR